MITRTMRAAAALLVAALLTLTVAATARAEFGIASLDTDTHLPNTDPGTGDPTSPPIPGRHTSQAGAHADSTIRFAFNTKDDGHGYQIPDGSVKEVEIDLPPGFTGNPQSVPQCDPVRFVDLLGGSCPASTQVGFARTIIGPDSNGNPVHWPAPIYNLRPAAGQTAAFGFYVVLVPVKIVASVRTDGDFGLRTTVSNISQGSNIFSQEITLWGNPADPVHDFQRYPAGVISAPPASSSAPRRPFITLPPACTGPQTTTLRVRSWENPERQVVATDVADDPDTGDTSGPKGCDKLRFDASLDFRPGETWAGAPAGYTARLRVPQEGSSDALGTAHVKDVRATLPEGVHISPSAADGLKGCTAAELRLGSREDHGCPEASRIGEVEIRTPLLSTPLRGEILLRAQTPERTFAIALVARGHGMTIKLPGEIDPDPITGRVVTTFRNNPQLPFDELTLRFKGGPRAPLTNPQTCGTKTTTTEITAWSGQRVTSTDSFAVDAGPDGGPCRDLGFDPTFSAGTMDPTAGGSSTFALTFGRSDADHDLRDITVQMPAGLTGRLALADACADGLAATGACPESSRIGSVTVASGAGSQPFNLPGRVYMTGPYKGAPLGMAIVVPAVAGPFDLGTVVVRTAVHVDKRSAALRVISDPMPTILQGVPLRVRTVDVRIDRRGFMVNPTSCATKAIEGTIAAVTGAAAGRTTRFRASDCGARPVKPVMSLTAGARRRTRGGVTTPLTVQLRQTPGQGNLRVVDVTLPRTLNSRLEVVSNRNACTPEQFAAQRCPQSIGTATAVTPLLRAPLRGSVYLVRSAERRLPDMVVALKGQVDIDLVGRIAIDSSQRVRTTFDTVPDVPISSFTLSLIAGRRGAVGIVGGLCTARARRTPALLSFRAHNGTRVERRQALRIRGCGSSARAGGRSGSRAQGRGRARTQGRGRARGRDRPRARRNASRGGRS